MKLKFSFFLLAIIIFFWISYQLYDIKVALSIAVISGIIASGVIFGVEKLIERISTRSVIGLSVGIFFASVTFFVIKEVIEDSNIPNNFKPYVSLLAFVVLFYFALAIGIMSGQDTVKSAKKMYQPKIFSRPKLLDTSVIIDGRISDVAEVGFLEGTMIVPKFIISELQFIADSSDPLKRVRGRRGLDILKKMQKDIPNVEIRITGHDYPKIKEVDLKLVELAKKIKATILTNDFNLNKIAGLHGVKVLNLNQLSNALKPVVLPGETMNILVVKEGKENNQGVGYLDDGTMVVVDDAKQYLGMGIEVSITSVLQTPTGRMIFSKVKDDNTASRVNV